MFRISATHTGLLLCTALVRHRHSHHELGSEESRADGNSLVALQGYHNRSKVPDDAAFCFVIHQYDTASLANQLQLLTVRVDIESITGALLRFCWSSRRCRSILERQVHRHQPRVSEYD